MSQLRWIPWALGSWLAGCIVLMGLGVGVRDALATAGVVTIQASAGVAIWLFLSRRGDRSGVRDRLEVVGMGLALGTLLSMLAGVIVNAFLPGHLGWLLPPAVALAGWLVSLRGAESSAREPVSWRRDSWVAFVVALAGGVVTIALNLTRYPLDVIGTVGTYHRDMLYFEALSTSVGVFGPGDSIFMSGAEVRYHWFVYAWSGQVSQAAGAEPFVVLTRVLPLVALVGCAALVVVWAARLSGRVSVAVLAALLLVTGGYVGAANGTILNFDSPSQDLTTLWLLAFLLAALGLLAPSGRRERLGLLIAVAVLAIGMTGGKISTAAVGIAPLALLAVVGASRRQRWASATWVAVAVSVVAASLTYLVVVSGSASAGDLRVLSWEMHASSIQGMDLWLSPLGVALGTMGFIMAVAARWAGLVWLVRDRATRWSPDVILGMGLVAVGLVPLVVLSQGVNETWFALSASAPLAALSAVGIGAAWFVLQNRATLAASLVMAAIVVALVPVFWVPGPFSAATARFWGPWVGVGLAVLGGMLIGVLWHGGQRRRKVWLASSLTILVVAGAGARAMPVIATVYHRATDHVTIDAPVGADAPASATGTLVESGPAPVMEPPGELLAGSPADRTAWSAAEADAARFLTDASVGSDIVVTNETTSFLVPALSRRLTYMTGAPYQGLYGGRDSVDEIPARIATSLAFTREADEAAFSTLCAAGVTWAWLALDGTPLRSWEPFAHIEFENDTVAVARLDRSRCP